MSRREAVIDAAERILETEGPEALTMRRLADALGIQAPSLYKHVKGKRDIEAALQERALASLGAALNGAAGDLAALARSYRCWALAHPQLYELATRRPLARDRVAAGAEAGAAAALMGVAGGDTAAARALWGFAHGLVDLELAGRFPADADLDATWAKGIEAAARGRAGTRLS